MHVHCLPSRRAGEALTVQLSHRAAMGNTDRHEKAWLASSSSVQAIAGKMHTMMLACREIMSRRNRGNRAFSQHGSMCWFRDGG